MWPVVGRSIGDPIGLIQYLYLWPDPPGQVIVESVICGPPICVELLEGSQPMPPPGYGDEGGWTSGVFRKLAPNGHAATASDTAVEARS